MARPAAQNVSNAAWAYGSLGVAHPAMFEALSAVAKASKLEGYNNQNITDLAWGFAQVGHNVGTIGRALLGPHCARWWGGGVLNILMSLFSLSCWCVCWSMPAWTLHEAVRARCTLPGSGRT